MMKTDKKKLLDKCDKLWSEVVRNRDNRCVLCGGYAGEPKKLQAHHWILSRGKSLRYRFDTRNGVALCYGCHIHQVHTNPTVSLIEELKDKCITSGIATESDIEEMKTHAHDINKLSIVDIEEIYNKLKNSY